jgi:DNA ligase (NAD+)
MSKDLKEYLDECRKAYFKGYPIISDTEYDNLELLYKGELPIGAPGGRTEHLYKMYSLQKYYIDEDVIPEGHRELYVETPKLDGAAVALRYLNGRLHSVVTRGNGEQGEDVTHLFQVMHRELCIPKRIDFGNDIINRENAINGFHQITGELVSPKRIPNARNYAAGALNLKDPREFYFKEVEFFAYDIQKTALNTYEAKLLFLRDCGFNTPYTHCTNHIPKDGMVYRLSDNEEYNKAGFTSKHPRGAYAIKERSEGVPTTLLRVDWETGKSGKVTPVAILDRVEIDGAMVSRATLNNPGFIKALDLHIGDAVMVERAGGIIPRIIRKL